METEAFKPVGIGQMHTSIRDTPSPKTIEEAQKHLLDMSNLLARILQWTSTRDATTPLQEALVALQDASRTLGHHPAERGVATPVTDANLIALNPPVGGLPKEYQREGYFECPDCAAILRLFEKVEDRALVVQHVQHRI